MLFSCLRLTLPLPIIATFFAAVFAKAGHYPWHNTSISTHLNTKRQSSSAFSVTGVHTGSGPNGSLPLRREIRELEQDQKSWDLYILGLDFMQSVDQEEMLSWYQIAGIHGRPYVPFDGVEATPGNEENGYCAHVSVLFPIWHRPYLALFEQVLYAAIQQIALLYPAGSERDAYVEAAANFRIPYWDWAMKPPEGQSVLPKCVGGSEEVTVEGPTGPVVIDNPLFTYKFHPLNATDLPDFPFEYMNETARYPVPTGSTSIVSQNDLVAQTLDSQASSIRDKLYNIFAACHDYTEFSNEAGNGTQNGCNSIESLHNDIHGIVGQSRGHMTYIMYSGFDPIFFLHHAMVDRIIAMWQVLNPDSYVVPNPAGSSAFTISRGEIVNGSTPLTPFHSDSFEGFWTAESARNISTFGYTYPELSSYSTTNISDNVLKAIDALYGGTAAAKNVSRTGRRSVAETPEDDPPDTYIEWFAEIRIPKNAFGRQPFCIHLFLGNPPRDTQMWIFKAAGSHCVSPRSPGTRAPNCTNCNDEELDHSTIPLTNALVDKVYASELRNLDPKSVRRFLQDNFKYRVVATKVTQQGRSNLKSLGITIVGMLTTLPRNEYGLPTWACVVARMDFTSGHESKWWEREYTEKGYIGCVEKMPSRVS